MKTFQDLKKIRQLLLEKLDQLDPSQLFKIPQSFKNNIWWNVGHLVVTQQLLHYQLSGLEMNLTSSQLERYRKGTSPKDWTSDPTTLEQEQVKSKLITQIDVLEKDYKTGIFKQFNCYTTSNGFELRSIEEAINFNLLHEGIHFGIVLSLSKII